MFTSGSVIEFVSIGFKPYELNGNSWRINWFKKITYNPVQQNVSNCVYILIKIDKYVFRIAGNQWDKSNI